MPPAGVASKQFLPLEIGETRVYAGFWPRLGAAIIDILVFIPFVLPQLLTPQPAKIQVMAFQIWGLLLGCGYSIILTALYGGTFGKLLLGVRVTRPDGGKISWKQAVLRDAVGVGFGILSTGAMLSALNQADWEVYLTANAKTREVMLNQSLPAWYGVVSWISAIWFWSELLVLLTNRRKRALHDFIAGTVVIKKPFAAWLVPATTGFPLPPLLRAERAGRELARRAKTGTGIVAGSGLALAAAWAAARQAANFGRRIEVIFSFRDGADAAAIDPDERDTPFIAPPAAGSTNSQPAHGDNDHPKPDANLAAHIMAETARRLGLASARQVSAGLGILPEREALSAAEFLRFTCAWRPEEGTDNPYLRPARAEEAQPAAAIRELDRRAIEDYGLPGLCLMENAGLGATAVAREMLSLASRPLGPVALLVGGGNNGGDALVVARELLTRGVKAKVVLLAEPAKLRGDAAANWAIYAGGGGPAEPAPKTDAAWDALLAGVGLIVDGLFGTGLARPLEGRAAQAVAAANRARERGAKILALDLPSGLDADSGEIRGAAVRADRTVTFAAPKLGFWRAAGPELAGEIIVAEIGFRLPKDQLR